MRAIPPPPEIQGDSFILVMRNGAPIPVLPKDVQHKYGGIWVPFGGQCHPRGDKLVCTYQGTSFDIHIGDVREIMDHHCGLIWSSDPVAV